MPLNLTKVAYGANSLDEMMSWFATRGDEAKLTTRYLPKRHAEMIGGSLFWILKHQLVARSEILRFEDAEDVTNTYAILSALLRTSPANTASVSLSAGARIAGAGLWIDAVSGNEVLRARRAGFATGAEPPVVMLTADVFRDNAATSSVLTACCCR